MDDRFCDYIGFVFSFFTLYKLSKLKEKTERKQKSEHNLLTINLEGIVHLDVPSSLFTKH